VEARTPPPSGAAKHGDVATTERDYYELLGLSRGASEQDIKSAFRKLARELHPDVSEAPDAEERFREVAEAYQVLSNSETRELYDRYGHAGLKGGGFTPGSFDFGNLSDIFSAFFGDDLFGMGGRTRRARGADIAAVVEIELAEAARGVTRDIPFQVSVTCDRCNGNGAEPGTSPITCPTCGGGGRVQQVSRSVFGEFVRTSSCPQCGGSGNLVTTPCTECDGSGRKVAERRLDVTIPAGIHDGQQIRISGEGHAGELGGRSGDVYVRVRVHPDPRFVRDGDDIFSTVHLNIVEAALGTHANVETLDGPIEIEFPPGTQPGEVRVLRGRGMPVLNGFGRGDQRVLVNVSVPRRISDEQRQLLDEFERLSTDETYKKDEGFFDKLKSVFR
jgi:molecular chaperone DnaJ